MEDKTELFIVGQNITQDQARYRKRIGELTRCGKGVYTRSDADVEDVIQRHAVRIAMHYFPGARVGHISAALIGFDGASNGVSNNFIYLSENGRSYEANLPGLNIVRAKSKATESVVMMDMVDSVGVISVPVSDPSQIIIDHFNAPSGHPDAAMSNDMFENMVVEAYEFFNFDDWSEFTDHIKDVGESVSTKQSTALALKFVNDVKAKLEESGYFQQHEIKKKALKDASEGLSFDVKWFRRSIGKLTTEGDGGKFSFEPDGNWLLPLSDSGDSERGLPYFLESSLPQGWLDFVTKHDGLDGLMRNRRFIANITASEDLDYFAPIDALDGALNEHTEDGVFIGRVFDLPTDEEFGMDELAAMWKSNSSSDLPMLSGFQTKVPMNLTDDGTLTPARRKAFTHILKLPPSGLDMDYMPMLEWTGMEMMREAGFEVPSVSLVRSGRMEPPSLLVERFDIPLKDEEKFVFAEDGFSAIGIMSTAELMTKFSAEKVFDGAIRDHSTHVDEDSRIYFRQMLASYIMGNGDMHPKNISIVKVANPSLDGFTSVRMSPVYDFSCSRAVNATFDTDMQQMSVNGKKVNLNVKDYIKLADHIGIPEEEAREVVTEISVKLIDAANTLRSRIPYIIKQDAMGAEKVEDSLVICQRNAEDFINQVNELEANNIKVAGSRFSSMQNR